jgi:preprotein translocase subunit YajC
MSGMIIILVGMFAIFYFMLIRPQRKRQSEHKALIEALQKGDKVITMGGMYGEIDYIDEKDIILTVEGGGKIKFLKSSIAGKQQIE